eukprot:gene14299-19180_t
MSTTKMSQNPPSDLTASIQKALTLHQTGNVNEAIIGYESALPWLPNNPTKAALHGNAGAIALMLGENDRALQHFQGAVEASPESAQAHFNLARLLTAQFSEHGRAIKHCGLAMKLDPKYHKAHHLMGNILQSINRPDEAEKYFVVAESLANGDVISQLESSNQENFFIYDISKYSVGNFYEQEINNKSYQLECICIRPLAFIVHNFLSDYECEHIIDRGQRNLEKSFTMGGNHQTSTSFDGNIDEKDIYRSSYTAWLQLDQIQSDIQGRLSKLLNISLPYLNQQAEDLQVVKYAHKGQFKVHHDSSAFHTRLFTALFYLNDVEVGLGGETWFPFGNDNLQNILNNTLGMSAPQSVKEAVEQSLYVYEILSKSESVDDEYLSLKNYNLCDIGLFVRPKKGQALIFFNHLPNGDIDPYAVHAGLPVGMIAKSIMANENNIIQNHKPISDDNIQKWISNYWFQLDQKLFNDFK